MPSPWCLHPVRRNAEAIFDRFDRDRSGKIDSEELRSTSKGIGAVVYKVPELNNDQMRKISLRSVDLEDTIPISQHLWAEANLWTDRPRPQALAEIKKFGCTVFTVERS
uniref:EF-hand domain-containing protein n=1 Tax=Ananas comosus var. bracteatus TaxID=296719 RepID=A0A6V7NYE1_ANACO|nr:unnamed protein product [Ananas comosus var. bracteatus]